MTSKRTGTPWMSADDYGRSLSGLGVNLLVTSVEESTRFATTVLSAEIVYGDVDFAVVKACGVEWMLHADHTYDHHPMAGVIEDVAARGCGIELRIHHCDPDIACANARKHGYMVLADPMDKPHGVREAFIVAPDGYIWVPDSPLSID